MEVSAISATIVCRTSLPLSIESVRQFVPPDIHVFIPNSVRAACAVLLGAKAHWHHIEPKNKHIRYQYDAQYWYSVFMTDPRLWEALKTPFVSSSRPIPSCAVQSMCQTSMRLDTITSGDLLSTTTNPPCTCQETCSTCCRRF